MGCADAKIGEFHGQERGILHEAVSSANRDCEEPWLASGNFESVGCHGTLYCLLTAKREAFLACFP